MSKQKLSATQQTILIAASDRKDLNIEPFPKNVTPGIRNRVVQGLLSRELITTKDDGYQISATGLLAIGKEPKSADEPKAAQPRVNTKQATMIELLKRPGGATIEDIASVTHWQNHTIRGTMSHALKKRMGLTITSTKVDNDPRRYRIEEGVQ